MSEPSTTPSRSVLLTLLTEACELEHALACCYLYAAFSLKTDDGEDGLTARETQIIRRWAGQISFVASQEMLHLAQAWNLLSSIGGTPYYLRPSFPQSSRFYPLRLPLVLERFDARTIDRFVAFEHPQWSGVYRAVAGEDLPPAFRTVGELYALIEAQFRALSAGGVDLFVGAPAAQVGEALADFPDLIPVVDLDSAIRAIDNVRKQGEGTARDHDDSHYGVFLGIASERLSFSTDPARRAIANPTADASASECELITNPLANSVAALFDSSYSLMLRLLGYAFQHGPEAGADARRLVRVSIAMMLNVVKPLGEALTQMPALAGEGNARAGAPFGLTRHVSLPLGGHAARIVAAERLDELASRAAQLAAKAPTRVADAAAHLGRSARWVRGDS